MSFNVLYLSYWNLHDGLTSATVFPSLFALRNISPTGKIIFVNIQREPLAGTIPDALTELNIIYEPILSGNSLTEKIRDFILGPSTLKQLCLKYGVSKVIARSSPAGALAYLLWRKIKIPFYVESFEPHAEYMVDSKVWKRISIQYLLQSYWENQQKKYASGLMPVAVSYQKQLIIESIDSKKIMVVPCVISSEQFSFNEGTRNAVRAQLNIKGTTIVGLYIGKYGGLYLAEESFRLYKRVFDNISDFFLIILCPVEYHSWIEDQVAKYRLPASQIMVKKVNHKEVAKYCSASDFAFATYKSGPSMKYLSPVKVGEYWANGLPVLMTIDVGDESSLIRDNFGGVLFDPSDINSINLDAGIRKLIKLIKSEGSRSAISKVGIQQRSPAILEKAYKYFLLNERD